MDFVNLIGKQKKKKKGGKSLETEEKIKWVLDFWMCHLIGLRILLNIYIGLYYPPIICTHCDLNLIV